MFGELQRMFWKYHIHVVVYLECLFTQWRIPLVCWGTSLLVYTYLGVGCRRRCGRWWPLGVTRWILHIFLNVMNSGRTSRVYWPIQWLFSFYNVFSGMVKLLGWIVDTCYFTSYSLTWSTANGSVSMLHLLVRLGLLRTTGGPHCQDLISGSHGCKPGALPLNYPTISNNYLTISQLQSALRYWDSAYSIGQDNFFYMG